MGGVSSGVFSWKGPPAAKNPPDQSTFSPAGGAEGAGNTGKQERGIPTIDRDTRNGQPAGRIRDRGTGQPAPKGALREDGRVIPPRSRMDDRPGPGTPRRPVEQTSRLLGRSREQARRLLDEFARRRVGSVVQCTSGRTFRMKGKKWRRIRSQQTLFLQGA
jgi:hypothetical protein